MSLQSDLEAQLSALILAITTALAAPAGYRWRVGQVEFDNTGYLKLLYEQQNGILDALRSIPTEVVDTIQDGVGVFGNDSAEYVNEDF